MNSNYLKAHLFDRLEQNLDEVAFYTKKKVIKNEEFLKELKRKISYFSNLNLDGKVVLFSLASYSFYVSLISLMYLGTEVVIIEKFSDLKVLSQLLKICESKYILVNNKTHLLSYFIKPFKGLIRMNDKCDDKNEAIINCESINYNKKIVHTFSSGTTKYKVISRSLDDLIKQFELVNSSFELVSNSCLSLMVMYVLVLLLNGVKIYLPKTFSAKSVNKELKYISKYEVNCLIASVSKLVEIKNDNTFKYVYTGGSKINYSDRIKLLKLYGNLTYMYGASEATVISKTTLKYYHKALELNENCVGEIVGMVDVKIQNDEVLVKSPSVITKDQEGYFHTSDRGYIKDGKLYLMGKIKYNNSGVVNGFILEDKLNRLYHTSFTYIYYNNTNYVVYYKKHLNVTPNDVKTISGYDLEFKVINRKTKKDIRHSYKQDYNSLIEVIEKYGK